MRPSRMAGAGDLFRRASIPVSVKEVVTYPNALFDRGRKRFWDPHLPG